jgi:5-methylcytosine-specific restriction endonuclease McrA
MKKWHGKNWIRPVKRLAIYIRDEFRCVYCGRDLYHVDIGTLSLDHVVCRSAGGNNDPSNLVTCCSTCNSSRGAKPLSVWADEPTRRAVRRNKRRSLTKPLRLAREILSKRVKAPKVIL